MASETPDDGRGHVGEKGVVENASAIEHLWCATPGTCGREETHGVGLLPARACGASAHGRTASAMARYMPIESSMYPRGALTCLTLRALVAGDRHRFGKRMQEKERSPELRPQQCTYPVGEYSRNSDVLYRLYLSA